MGQSATDPGWYYHGNLKNIFLLYDFFNLIFVVSVNDTANFFLHIRLFLKNIKHIRKYFIKLKKGPDGIESWKEGQKSRDTAPLSMKNVA